MVFGGKLQLTTPEICDYDSVFPGENWMFYWKTSPSLWKTKLLEFNSVNPVLVPVYWGFHNESIDHYDFGTYKPEANLKKLIEIAQEIGREVILVIPISPTPFLPNGGVPSFVAGTSSVSKEGLSVVAIDAEDRLYKMFSYYDPRVFQMFRKFCWQLGQYISQLGIKCEVFGADYGYMEKGSFISYREDYSSAFEKGFSRYINQLQESEPETVNESLNLPNGERLLQKKFEGLIYDLYEQSVSETMAANFGKVIPVAMLGGGTSDILKNAFDSWEMKDRYIGSLFSTLIKDILPCSALLSQKNKKGLLDKCLKDLITSSFIKKTLDNAISDEDEAMSFMPMVFFDIFEKEKDGQVSSSLESQGLLRYFDRNFQLTFRFKRGFSDELDEAALGQVYIVSCEDLDLSDLSKLLKLFMSGAKIVLDLSQLDKAVENRVQQFIIENGIELEKVNFVTELSMARLGEGSLVLYRSEKLMSAGASKKMNFWSTIVKFLDLKNLKVECDSDIFFFWRSRGSNTYELNYEQIRRVSFYNPTSYKKKAKILTTGGNFAFLKSIDQTHASVQSMPVGISLELLPGGSVSLDFGYYE